MGRATTPTKRRPKTTARRRAKLDELKAQCDSLSARDRSELADYLLDSLGEDKETVRNAWEEELDRRMNDIRAGRVKGIPAEKVFAEMRKKYP